MIALAVLYYASGYWLRRSQNANGWDQMLLYSGLGLGVLTSLSAPFQGGLEASIPVAITATLVRRGSVRAAQRLVGITGQRLYLMSYFMILFELNVDEPQYYSIGAALLGMLMHYLLTRAGSKTGAFIAGHAFTVGIAWHNLYSNGIHEQAVILLCAVRAVHGRVDLWTHPTFAQSRDHARLCFAVLGVMTVIYSALKGLGPVILIGSTGVLLLMAGIIAVLMRERITRLGEQLSEWKP